MTAAFALLRAGFPYVKTLGMRRFTSFPIDLAVAADGSLFVLCSGNLGADFREIRHIGYDETEIATIGASGNEEGQFTWPGAIALDRDENLYVSDQALSRISIFDRKGTFLGRWGEAGSGPGQIDRPLGIAFDHDENLYVVDALNHRVQKFRKDGTFLQTFGEFGTGEGQFNMPWGIAIDDDGDVYVSDWRNDRIQKLSAEGRFIFALGSSGAEKGQFNRPAGIAVDSDGDIYVADWLNNRVQLFSPNGRYVQQFLGDGTLSARARTWMLAGGLPLRQRETVDLEQQKYLRAPTSVRLDRHGRLYIADCGCHRIQIYQKEAIRLEPGQLAPPLRSPQLITV